MYHFALCIDGTEYKLAVNITGKGAPTSATEANVGMFYMDEDSGEVYKRTVRGWERFVSNVESHTLQEAKDYADSLIGNIYDLVITSDEEFSKCLYALDGGSANTEFEHTNVLVKDVVFKIQHGSSDLDLHIFQPSIKHIKFENCRWETEWWVSGKVPTTLAAAGTQYERAAGDFDLVIDGIEVSVDNVQAAKDAGEYWYIGLRNIKALINSTVRYPEGYDLSNGWNFKLTCQYFDYASNNHVPALWDGTNVSDCYITEKLVRCKGCVNIASAPVMKNGVLNPVAVQWCVSLSNFSGDFSYHSCTSVNYDTCEGIEEPSTQQKPYDYIVRNMTELRDVLTKSLVGRRILLRDFTINTADTLDFKWAGYVGFSNMLFGADINLANAWELDGAGLDASHNKWSVTVEGAGRSRVCNFGRLPGSSTESKYTFKKCRLVTGCIVGEATECSAIHGCYISLNADVVISGCTDICGLTVVPSGRTASITLSGCKNISHISNKGSGSIIYTNCTNVDYLTCDGAEADEDTDLPTIDTSNLANALKGNVSGTSITIDDLSPLTSKLRVNVAGKQTDEGAVATVAETGEETPVATSDELVNLVPFPYKDAEVGETKTSNGVTFLVNEDGSITASGKATGVAVFYIFSDLSNFASFNKNMYYTKYKQNFDGAVFRSNYYYKMADGTNSTKTFANGDGASSTIGDEAIGLYINITVSKDTDLGSGVTIYPMIVEGKNVEITEYVPPQGAEGGNDTPSTPSTPTAVTVKSCGKNIIPYPYKEGSKTSNGITWTVNEDGSITANGTATGKSYFSLLNTTGVNTILPFDAFLSCCPSGGGTSTYYIAITNDQGGYSTEHGNGFQLVQGYEYDEIYIAIVKGYTANNLTFKPMIEFGTAATEYEPYKKGETITTAPGETVDLTPIFPSMVITTDSDLVILSTEYNRDTNKVIEKLTQAIIALGGNV